MSGAAAAGPGDGDSRLLVFRLGAELFGVELGTVSEVVDAPPVRPVPDAPATMLGVAALRDGLIPILDPRGALNLHGSASPSPDGRRGSGAALVFDVGGRRVGLAVDDVVDVMTLERGALRHAPGVDAGDRILRGVLRRNTDLIGVLDAPALLTALTNGA